MENEDAFAAEAQDQARTERSSSVEPGNAKGLRSRTREAEGSDDEQVPLINRQRLGRDERPGTDSRKSYERAINQPWTGAQGSAGLPWYKQPSVCTSKPCLLRSLTLCADILAPARLLSLLPCFRRADSPQNLPDPRSHVQGLLLGSRLQRSVLHIHPNHYGRRESAVSESSRSVNGCELSVVFKSLSRHLLCYHQPSSRSSFGPCRTKMDHGICNNGYLHHGSCHHHRRNTS